MEILLFIIALACLPMAISVVLWIFALAFGLVAVAINPLIKDLPVKRKR